MFLLSYRAPALILILSQMRNRISRRILQEKRKFMIDSSIVKCRQICYDEAVSRGTYKCIFSAANCAANHSTKNVPCVTADLFGERCEELILRIGDNAKLRIWFTRAAENNAVPAYLLTTCTLTAEQAAQSDMNGDNHLNAVDLSLLKRVLLL